MGTNQEPTPIRVESVSLVTMTGDHPRCSITMCLTIDGMQKTLAFQSELKGIGPVSGICHAFREVVPQFDWSDFSVKAAAAGENADAMATVTLKKGGNTFAGQGRHINTMHATANAVADALHKLRWHDWKFPAKRTPEREFA